MSLANVGCSYMVMQLLAGKGWVDDNAYAHTWQVLGYQYTRYASVTPRSIDIRQGSFFEENDWLALWQEDDDEESDGEDGDSDDGDAEDQ